MRTGTATPAAFFVTCPYCRDQYVCPTTYSYMIGRDSVDALAKRDTPGVATCQGCGLPFKLPANVMKAAG